MALYKPTQFAPPFLLTSTYHPLTPGEEGDNGEVESLTDAERKMDSSFLSPGSF